jgi:NTE family protein
MAFCSQIKYFNTPILRWVLMLISSSCSLQTKAQSAPITNIAMEGSGIRAFAYVGALQVLDSAGYLASVKNVGGTSGGAIIAALYAVGYATAELDSIAHHIPVQSMADDGGFMSRRILRIRKKYGLYKGNAFTLWLGKLIAAKQGTESLTLGQLHALTLAGKTKDVYCVAVDLTTQKALVLSYKTFPDMKLADAVRASMSIPLVYKAVFMDKQGRLYEDVHDADSLHVLVDGGLLHNFPIGMFDSMTAPADGPAACYSTQCTIGIMIEDFDYLSEHDPFIKINTIKDYGGAVYHTIIDRRVVSDEDRKRSIIIPLRDIAPSVRKIPIATVEYMLQQGKTAARHFVMQQ